MNLENYTIPLKFTQIKWIFIGLIFLMFIGGILGSIENGTLVWKEARNTSGGLSWILLLFIVYVSLLSKLFPKIALFKQLFPLRRFAGILVFGIVMSHAIFHFLRSGVLGNFEGMIFQALQRNWAITLGTIAFICMIPLFFTSTPKSIQKLGQKNWFALHKINHLIFILASLHIGFLSFSEKGDIDPVPLMFLGIYIAGYGYLGYAGYKKRN